MLPPLRRMMGTTKCWYSPSSAISVCGSSVLASWDAAACPATDRCSKDRARAAEIASTMVTITMEMILSSSAPMKICRLDI